jgi:hypothetical protein
LVLPAHGWYGCSAAGTVGAAALLVRVVLPCATTAGAAAWYRWCCAVALLALLVLLARCWRCRVREVACCCCWRGCVTRARERQGYTRVLFACLVRWAFVSSPWPYVGAVPQSLCCIKRGVDKLKGKENCAMYQFKEGVGCFHGKSKQDCGDWKDARDTTSRGWFGGEVNSQNMESQVRRRRLVWLLWLWLASEMRLVCWWLGAASCAG